VFILASAAFLERNQAMRIAIMGAK